MKRYLSMFMGMVLFFVSWTYGLVDNRQAEAASNLVGAVMYGDVDQDGTITLKDAQLSLGAVLKITTLPEAGRAAMDVDGNGSLALSDVQKILQRALKIIDHFPVEEETESTDELSITEKPDVTEPPVPSEPAGEEGKTLIVYFSWSSNTEKMADTIQKHTNGTVYEIVPLTPYPENYTRCTEVALEERDGNARPAIKEPLDSIEEYDRILIGYPIWWHTAPMIIGTFLEHYDLTGVDIYPFSQSASMNTEQFHNSMEFIRSCADNANVHDGLFASYSNEDAIVDYLMQNNLMSGS